MRIDLEPTVVGPLMEESGLLHDGGLPVPVSAGFEQFVGAQGDNPASTAGGPAKRSWSVPTAPEAPTSWSL